MLRGMKVPIDKAGRLVIPRQVRERIGLVGAGVVEIEIEGSGLRLRPVEGSDLREEGDLLVIPRSGAAIDDEAVRELIDATRYGR
jgi:bifunctional DNA-binding transcriptional regulator/antitoxin component of YhaV-PrlF toxin-antitoxin module